MKGDPKTPTVEWIESWKNKADGLYMLARMAQAKSMTWDKLGPHIGQDLLSILVRFPIVCEEALKHAKAADAGRQSLGKQSSRNKADADRRVTIAFDLWQQGKRQVLQDNGRPYSMQERVRKYLLVKRSLPDRDRRRLRALLKVGKIPPL